jgi:DNA helicase-2/ATP-dependent DNA helicase PcrA
MGEASSEQQAILDNPNRIRIVRAAPGSGKTWLVGELIRKELSDWKYAGGIAALSFTRVGGEEIRKSVGYELDHPHFVGTIDAFLFRYVIRPFLSKVFSDKFAKPRLVPAHWEPNFWNKGPNSLSWPVSKLDKKKRYNLLSITYTDLVNRKPVLAILNQYGGGAIEIPQEDRDKVWDAKKDLWKKHGWITHADTAFLAYHILSSKDHGKTICGQLSSRFPFLIVDELQDTGFFLGKTISSLLAYQTIRALLVGDPDQAIYEFNGARPELFDEFAKIEGAQELALGASRRCPQNVIQVASSNSMQILRQVPIVNASNNSHS